MLLVVGNERVLLLYGFENTFYIREMTTHTFLESLLCVAYADYITLCKFQLLDKTPSKCLFEGTITVKFIGIGSITCYIH